MNRIDKTVTLFTDPADFESSQSRNEIIKNYDWVIPENPLEEQIYKGAKVECLCIELKPKVANPSSAGPVFISIPLIDILSKTSYSLDKVNQLKKELARIQKELNRLDKLSDAQKNQFYIKFNKNEVVRAIDSICEAHNLFLGINSVAQKALKQGLNVIQKADGLYGGGRVEQVQTKDTSISAEEWLRAQKKKLKQSYKSEHQDSQKKENAGLESVVAAEESQKKSKSGKGIHKTEKKLKQLYKDLEETQASVEPPRPLSLLKRWKFNYFSNESALVNKKIKLHNEINRLTHMNLARKERIIHLDEEVKSLQLKLESLPDDSQKALLKIKIKGYENSIIELKSLMQDTSKIIKDFEQKHAEIEDKHAKDFQHSASKLNFFSKILACVTRCFNCFNCFGAKKIESPEVSQNQSPEISDLGTPDLDSDIENLHRRVRTRHVFDVVEGDVEDEFKEDSKALSPRESQTGRDLVSSSFSLPRKNAWEIGTSRISKAFSSLWSKGNRKKRKAGAETIHLGKLYKLAQSGSPREVLNLINDAVTAIFETENTNENINTSNHNELKKILEATRDEGLVRNCFNRNKQLIEQCQQYFEIIELVETADDTDSIPALLEGQIQEKKDEILSRLQVIFQILHSNEDIAVSKLPILKSDRHFVEEPKPNKESRNELELDLRRKSKSEKGVDSNVNNPKTISSPEVSSPIPTANSSATVNPPVVDVAEVFEVDVNDVFKANGNTVFHGMSRTDSSPPPPSIHLTPPPAPTSPIPLLPPKLMAPPPLPLSPPPPLPKSHQIAKPLENISETSSDESEEEDLALEEFEMGLAERERANAFDETEQNPPPISATAATANTVYHASSSSYVPLTSYTDADGNVMTPNGIGDGIEDSVAPEPLSKGDVDTRIGGIEVTPDSEVETPAIPPRAAESLTPLQALIKQMSQTTIAPEQWSEIIDKANAILPQITKNTEKNSFFRSIFTNLEHSFKNRLIEQVKTDSEMSELEFNLWSSLISKLEIPHNEADVKNKTGIDQEKVRSHFIESMKQKFKLHHQLNWLSVGLDKNSQREFRKSIEEIDGKLNFDKRNELILKIKGMNANDEPSKLGKIKVLAYLIHDEFTVNIKKMHENHLLAEEPKVKGEEENISLLENLTTKFEALKSTLDESNYSNNSNVLEKDLLDILREAEVYSESSRRLTYLFKELQFTNVNFENSQLPQGFKAYPHFIKEMFGFIHDEIIYNSYNIEAREWILDNHIERIPQLEMKDLCLESLRKTIAISKIYKNYEAKIIEQTLYEAGNRYTDEGEELIKSFINDLRKSNLINEYDATYENGLPYIQKLKKNIKLIDTFKKYRIETYARETITRLAKDENYDQDVLKEFKSRIIQKLYVLCKQDENFIFNNEFKLEIEQIKKIMTEDHYKTKMIKSFKKQAKKAETDAESIYKMISLTDFVQLSPEKKELNKAALFELCKDISNRIKDKKSELEQFNKLISTLGSEVFDNEGAIFAAFECNQFILDFQALEKAIYKFSEWKWERKEIKILQDLTEQSRPLYNQLLSNQNKYNSVLNNEQALDSSTRQRALSQHKKVGDVGRSIAKSRVRSIGESFGRIFKRKGLNKKKGP